MIRIREQKLCLTKLIQFVTLPKASWKMSRNLLRQGMKKRKRREKLKTETRPKFSNQKR